MSCGKNKSLFNFFGQVFGFPKIPSGKEEKVKKFFENLPFIERPNK